MGEELLDSRTVEKVFVVLLEKFESKISSLEESKDLSKIKLDRACKCPSSSRTEKTSQTRKSNRNSLAS